MTPVTSDNFGFLIAYLLPGFVALWGGGYFSETIRSWLAASPTTEPTIGGFLYSTLASTAAGLVVSAVRWLLIDRLHHTTGVSEPSWDFSQLRENLQAFEGLVQNHYRYYQFYSNMLVAISFSYFARFVATGRSFDGAGPDVAFLLIWLVLFAGSRDALRKYYLRTRALFSGTMRRSLSSNFVAK